MKLVIVLFLLLVASLSRSLMHIEEVQLVKKNPNNTRPVEERK